MRLVRRRTVTALLATALMALLVACDDNDNLRSDVVLCESAIAHVVDCCAEKPSLSCEYRYEDHTSLHLGWELEHRRAREDSLSDRRRSSDVAER